ncbi:unnamed protein product [Periconia digitata]|uniref:Uncharacterized protein n=1 Tax=Periconia digitata TaxID=1303443 RepID=A0A9W4UP92_9PLEO|nr:unnamed protein product [Periconia digitata]
MNQMESFEEAATGSEQLLDTQNEVGSPLEVNLRGSADPTKSRPAIPWGAMGGEEQRMRTARLPYCDVCPTRLLAYCACPLDGFEPRMPSSRAWKQPKTGEGSDDIRSKLSGKRLPKMQTLYNDIGMSTAGPGFAKRQKIDKQVGKEATNEGDDQVDESNETGEIPEINEDNHRLLAQASDPVDDQEPHGTRHASPAEVIVISDDDSDDPADASSTVQNPIFTEEEMAQGDTKLQQTENDPEEDLAQNWSSINMLNDAIKLGLYAPVWEPPNFDFYP